MFNVYHIDKKNIFEETGENVADEVGLVKLTENGDIDKFFFDNELGGSVLNLNKREIVDLFGQVFTFCPYTVLEGFDKNNLDDEIEEDLLVFAKGNFYISFLLYEHGHDKVSTATFHKGWRGNDKEVNRKKEIDEVIDTLVEFGKKYNIGINDEKWGKRIVDMSNKKELYNYLLEPWDFYKIVEKKESHFNNRLTLE